MLSMSGKKKNQFVNVLIVFEKKHLFCVFSSENVVLHLSQTTSLKGDFEISGSFYLFK